MSKKLYIYIGILLIILGILIRVFTNYPMLAMVLMVLGGLSKLYYLSLRIKQGSYKPGYELLMLILGLLIFFTGIYIKNYSDTVNPWYFMGPGILLKLSFVVLFVKKMSNK